MTWPAHQTAASLSRHFRSLLRSYARHSALHDGEKLHAIIITTGLSSILDSYILNTLLHLYAKCGHFDYARKLFDRIPNSHKDAVDWTVLIASYSQHKRPIEALSLFRQMHGNDMKGDQVTMLGVLNGCAQLGDMSIGNHWISYLVKMGLPFTVKVCNSLIDMYAKCGSIGEAKRVFEEMGERSEVTWVVLLDGVLRLEGLEKGKAVFDSMPERNEVAWTVMIKGYIEHGFTNEAFSLLSELLFGIPSWRLGCTTICSILSACAHSGDSAVGRWIHVYALKTMGHEEMDIMVATSLVNMYAKCGMINTALKFFDTIQNRNVVTWNAVLSGLAMHGRSDLIVEIFPSMMKEAKPDDITLTIILTACSHSGLVDQGLRYFNSMESIYGITPQIEHHSCVVDLLGRVGRLEEAEKLIRQMPMSPNEVVLGSLLGSCSLHGKLHLAEKLLHDLVDIYPNNTECHVLLSNMYALEGKQEKASSLRRVLKEKGIRKTPGMSYIHIGGQVHRFTAGDTSHPCSREIYLKLDEVIQKLRMVGYVPKTWCQVFSGFDGDRNAEELEEKEQALLSHSEKLAVCFGLLSTKPGSVLYIFKNLRICQDCHSAMKMISKIYNREIVVRDRSRFHSFQLGSCSCSDYW